MKHRLETTSGFESTYIVGSAVTTEADLPGVLAAINYLRDKYVTITAGTFSPYGDRVAVPIAMRCDSPDSPPAMEGAVSGLLDSCSITWRVVKPRASSPESIRIAARLDATEGGRNLTMADIAPRRTAGDPFLGIVGMDAPIADVRRVVRAMKAYGRKSVESPHMLFIGRPGVGKTLLAERTAEHLMGEGLIRRFHKVSAAEMIAEYVGQTPHLVRRAFDAADEGLLFIDEAYSLSDGEANAYGEEAVNALVECLDARRDRTIVIAAGYPEHMRRFLDGNPGLRGRFGAEVRFEDYGPDELAEIYRAYARGRGFSLERFDDDLLAECERLPKAEGYAAARTVRRLFDESVIAAAEAHPDERLITLGDFRVALSRCKVAPAAANAIGFS